MKKWQFLILTAYSLVLFLLFGNLTAHADEELEHQYRILFISSYGFSNVTVPKHLEGFEDGLGELNVLIDYEFMDSDSYYRSTDIDNFGKYLRYKYFTSQEFDLIVAADDPALRFINNYRSEIFKDKPTVFMGVNNLTEATTAAALQGVTGIAEIIDIEDNYLLMKNLFPDRNNLVVVVDSTNAGQGNYVEFLKFKDNHPEVSSRVINTSYYTADGLKEAFSLLGDNDIILFLDFSIDGENNLYSLRNAANFIAEYTGDVPVFRMASADIAHGVLGGISYSYYDAGLLAGKMANRILKGEDPDSLEFVTTSISEPVFEQGEMDVFGIRHRDIPKNSKVINETQNLYTFYRDNKTVCNLTIALVILMLVLIIVLSRISAHRARLIRTDYLTGLPNRAYLMEKIGQAVEANNPYGVIMIDIDHFKTINDTKGHLVGDEIIIGVADRLKELSHKDVSFARLGGDEFAGIILHPSKETEPKICESIIDIMKKEFDTSTGKIKITVSVGCAIYPEETNKKDMVMECADQALYEVKERGKNGYALFSSNNETT